MNKKLYDDTPFIDDSNEGYYSPATWEEALALKPAPRPKGPRIYASLYALDDEDLDFPQVRYNKDEDRLEFSFILVEAADGVQDKVLVSDYPMYIYSNEKLVLTEMDFPAPYTLYDAFRACMNAIEDAMAMGGLYGEDPIFPFFFKELETRERLRQKYKPE